MNANRLAYNDSYQQKNAAVAIMIKHVMLGHAVNAVEWSADDDGTTFPVNVDGEILNIRSGRGTLLGLMLHDHLDRLEMNAPFYSWSVSGPLDAADVFGVPPWMIQLAESLFISMNRANANRFAVQFLEAIPVGVNLYKDFPWGLFALSALNQIAALVETPGMDGDAAETFFYRLNALSRLHQYDPATIDDLFLERRINVLSAMPNAMTRVGHVAAIINFFGRPSPDRFLADDVPSSLQGMRPDLGDSLVYLVSQVFVQAIKRSAGYIP